MAMDNLTMDAIAAERANMSYGKWKALHPNTKPKEKKERNEGSKIYRKCVVCGKQFAVSNLFKVVCSKECRAERERSHARAYQEKYQPMYRQKMKQEG